MDNVGPETRSRMMSAVRRSGTKIEHQIRRDLHARGFRFRVDVRELPGRPDLALRKHNAVIFVHGCFWHGHDCRLFRLPATRQDFWRTKLAANRQRDVGSIRRLHQLGWRIAIVWECALRGVRQADVGGVLQSLSGWIQSESAYLELRGS